MAIITDSTSNQYDIYMLRVGQSAARAEGTLAGNEMNDSPLSERGRLDAAKAGEHLVQLLNSAKQVHIFTADDVLRMKETTNFVAEKLKEANIAYTRQSDSSLGGKDHGVFNGTTKEQRTQNPELVAAKEKKKGMSAEERFKTPVEGGESKQNLVHKATELFKKISQQRLTGPVVVVTSNNTLSALTAVLNKEEPYKSMHVGYRDVVQLQQSAEGLKMVKIHPANVTPAETP